INGIYAGRARNSDTRNIRKPKLRIAATTREDFALLPPYCIAQLKPSWSKPGEPERWRANIPKAFPHLHHYCAALHSLRQAQGIYGKDNESVMVRTSMLRSSVLNNIGYMEKQTDPSSKLFPHIYTTKAEAYLMLDQAGEAFEYFNKAIAADRKFTKPYALMADYYAKNNNKKEARKILEEGLKHSPKSKQLNRRLDKLPKK
ncbi:MAG: tetratricopeptide repeat protein, partial [Methyloprofundus sp.]|nr:tetratricopeptide repeat protein [Methyloprofundus sp.]